MKEKRYIYITPKDYEIAKKNGIKENTLYSRVSMLNWDVDRAISEPVKKYKSGRWEKWKDQAIVPYGTFVSRIRNGMSEKDAALTPFIPHKGRYVKELPFTEEQFKLAESKGISRALVLQRYNNNKWSIEDCITIPKLNRVEAAKFAVKRRRESKGLKTVWQ